MADPFFVRKQGSALVPTSRAGQIAIDKLKAGVQYRVTPAQPRNTAQHRLFWAFVTYVSDALNSGPAGAHWDAEDVKDDLLVACGFTNDRPMSRLERERHSVPDGAVAIVSRPKSIAFHKMSQDEFGKFMEAAFLYVRDELAPWIVNSPDWPHIETILAESHISEENEG
jgi:hypothetical protein